MFFVVSLGSLPPTPVLVSLVLPLLAVIIHFGFRASCRALY